MGRRVDAADAEWVVAFVNEFASRPRETAGEAEDEYPVVTEIGIAPPAASELATPALVAVADLLHPVFAASSVTVATTLLDALLVDVRPLPRLESTAGRPQLRWELETAESALIAACCLALVDVVARFGSDDRLGTCRAQRCDDVYIDRSQAASRRYCSLTCQNRTRVMSHRARTARRRGTAS